MPNVVVPAYVANGDLDVVVVPSSDVAVYKLLPNAAHCVTRRLFALLGETVLAFRAGKVPLGPVASAALPRALCGPSPAPVKFKKRRKREL